MDHGDLEQRAVGQHALGDLADERDVVDHLGGDPAADVAHDDRVAEAEAEEVRGVDARVEAGDHEQAQGGEDDGALVAAGGGEGAVALERRVRSPAWSSWSLLMGCVLGLGSGQLRAAAGRRGRARTSGASSAPTVGWAGSSASAISAPAAATPAAR